MNFSFTEEQEELRESARSFLADQAGSDALRKAMESELGYDADLWQQIASELGWTSMIVPEEFGGLGLSYVELVALFEITGSALLCSPLFATIGLGANALLVAGNDAQKKEYLPGIAAGDTRATVAYMEAKGRPDATGIRATAWKDGSDYVIDGSKSFVLDGHCADLLIVAARREGSNAEDGVSLFAVDANAKGLSRRVLTTMDQTRRMAELKFEGLRVPASALLGEEGAGWPALDKTLQLAAVALAAEQVGGAQRCLDMSVSYAKEREQFGRAIGSFQALKHKCADMFVLVESARSAAYYGGCVAAEDSDELLATASLAKAYCSDAFFKCAAESLQIHGGVGFTWEYDVHLYFKRAKSAEIFLGSPDHHRERVARQIGL
ncbi:MAG: acyl-CoA/acyl-ACP dehydrogenase [bacterium]|nr:acyl-CoA/acyl-ACP dehydrogenase [bacterium]